MSSAPPADASCTLLNLGADVLPRVVLSLSHVDWARLAPVSRVFRSIVADARAACSHASPSTLQLTAPVLSRSLGQGLFSCVLGLRTLALSGQAGIDDAQLQSLTVLQQLHSLDISATQVTSRGLQSLYSMQELQQLDITFCPVVSYSAVLLLRRHCPNLRLIRRQPKWLDGHFETPWGELHSYYPCGAFSFSRQVESEGWVAQLKDCGDYLENRLLFMNLPHWQNYNGLIGVLLKQLHSSDAQQQRVVVLQSLHSYEPPPLWPPFLGLLPPAGSTVNAPDAGVMVSTMVVRPLQPGETQPPADLQARLLHFCDAREASAGGGLGSLVRRDAEVAAIESIHDTSPHPDFLDDEFAFAPPSQPPLVLGNRIEAGLAAVFDALVADPLHQNANDENGV